MTRLTARSSAAAPQKLSIIFLFMTKAPRDVQGGCLQYGSQLESGRCGGVYLNQRCEKRGEPTQWRFRNVLRYGRDT